MRKSLRFNLLTFLFGSVCIVLFNEFFLYYVVIWQCSWPAEPPPSNGQNGNEHLKAMILADPHLLGPRRGHWFDKLRREWQMHRSFQTANTLFSPDIIFILGDVFDEGLWVNPNEFQDYVNRFHSIFPVTPSTRLVVIVGNHDIGFHYVITPNLHKRFEKAFNSSSVQLLTLKGVSFVLINSMAMERDGCFLCSEAMKKLQQLSDELDCKENSSSKKCKLISFPKTEKYSRPILLQHFPLFRESDKLCTGVDAAPEHEKSVQFRQTWDCLSESSSKLLLELLRPRLIMSGHTHHGCLYNHTLTINDDLVQMPEYSVSSFSWRNRDNPSFYLGVFSRNHYELSKCQMPKESTLKIIYIIGFGGLTLHIFLHKFLLATYRIMFSRIMR